jgi:Glycosyltransferase family 87
MRASAGELAPVQVSPWLPSLARARGAATAVRRGIGLLSLAAVVYLGASIATGTAAAPTRRVPARLGGFPAWMRGPLDGVGLPLSRAGFVIAIVAMFAAYVVALVCVGALRARWTLGAILLLHVVIFLGPPLLSADVIGYLDWARMGALHGLSPYTHDSGTVVSDGVFPFVRWDRFTSPYGPLFTLISYAYVPLGLAGSLWALKATALLASLGICGLIWNGAGRLGLNRGTAVALYGLNPTVIVYGLGGAHNDLLATAIVLAGAILVLHGRDGPGGAVSALAVAVKASSGVVLPFLLLGAEQRRRALAGVAAAAGAMAVVALAVFGPHAGSALGVVGHQQTLEAGTTVIAQLGDWLGYVGDPPAARAVAGVVLAGTVAVLLWRTWRGGPWLEAAAWATLAVLLTTSWLLPWYVVWLMPLAALARGRALRIAAVAMSAFVVSTHLALIAETPTSADVRPLLHPGACLGADQAGCPGTGHATDRLVLGHALARSFKLSYQAERRMVSGRLGPRPVRYAKVRCRAASGSRWTCAVKYFLRGRPERHRAVYAVAVDPRGCFAATSTTFPTHVPERVLDGPAVNPLARIRSCP